MKNYYLLVICIGAIFNVKAENSSNEQLTALKAKVEDAIAKAEQTNSDLWSYKLSRYENEEGDVSSSIEHYKPQSNEQWILEQINGQTPTKSEIKEFLENKQEQKGNIQVKLRQLINQQSLSIVSVDQESFVMAFNVNLKKLGDDSVGKLQGELTYNQGKQFIETISIWNNAEFSPMFTANITDLAITFTFVDIDGAVLVNKNEMMMKGSFAYFTEINETSVDTYSDYLYLGNEQSNEQNNEKSNDTK